MKTSSQNPYAEYASDEVVFIPRKLIHPDPDQPRVNADAELRASIETQGIIQAITVRPHPELADAFLIVDGERRYNGAVALAEIPCRIRLDLEDDADRLITQITANTGKPLSPIEQARAFKKILDVSEDLTQVELAKRLGLPRSTVGDRIRLLEIHPAWVQLIEDGKLQLSHAPAMHRFREVPEKYQFEAVQRLLSKGTGYGLGHDIAKGEPIRIDLFESRLRDCFRPFMRAVSDVPGYKGPTVEFKDWDARRKYAVDPDQWKPIRNAQIKRAKEKRKKDGGADGANTRGPQRTSQQVDIERLAKAGIPVHETKQYTPAAAKGEVEIFNSRGWFGGIDAEALLRSIDRSTVRIRKSSDRYSSAEIVVTTDVAAVEQARNAYIAALRAAAAEACSKIRSKLADTAVAAHEVRGPGAIAFTANIDEYKTMAVLAMAFGVDVDSDVDQWGRITISAPSQVSAERLLSLAAAAHLLKLHVPPMHSITAKLSSKRQSVRFVLPEPVSKKQEKREARARGEQVGDPSRAPAPRARQFEEELVGA